MDVVVDGFSAVLAELVSDRVVLVSVSAAPDVEVMVVGDTSLSDSSVTVSGPPVVDSFSTSSTDALVVDVTDCVVEEDGASDSTSPAAGGMVVGPSLTGTSDIASGVVTEGVGLVVVVLLGAAVVLAGGGVDECMSDGPVTGITSSGSADVVSTRVSSGVTLIGATGRISFASVGSVCSSRPGVLGDAGNDVVSDCSVVAGGCEVVACVVETVVSTLASDSDVTVREAAVLVPLDSVLTVLAETAGGADDEDWSSSSAAAIVVVEDGASDAT